MADEIPNRTDMVGKLLGERQSFTHQPRHPLPQGIVKALDVIGLPGSVSIELIDLVNPLRFTGYIGDDQLN